MISRKRRELPTEEASWVLESKLEPGMLRFMAHVIENGLQIGLRTQEDFIRSFPPIDIMMGLTERPDLRANILVPTTGIRPKIAFKKTAESCGADLQIALDEGETDAELIVSLFHPDDRVRYLDRSRLWTYVSEPKFWEVRDRESAEFKRAKAHIAFFLDRAIEDHLITYQDIVDGLTVATLVNHLPLPELQALIERALMNSHSGKPFGEEDLLTAVPTRHLVDHVPLSVLWDSVIHPKVAVKHGLAGRAEASESGNLSTAWEGETDDSDVNGSPESTGEVVSSDEDAAARDEASQAYPF